MPMKVEVSFSGQKQKQEQRTKTKPTLQNILKYHELKGTKKIKNSYKYVFLCTLGNRAHQLECGKERKKIFFQLFAHYEIASN